jgi:hypothetical protein
LERKNSREAYSTQNVSRFFSNLFTPTKQSVKDNFNGDTPDRLQTAIIKNQRVVK